MDLADKNQTTSNNKTQNGLFKNKFINAISTYQAKTINDPVYLA